MRTTDLRWVRDRLITASDHAQSAAAAYNITVAPPLYPAHRSSEQLPLSETVNSDCLPPDICAEDDLGATLMERRGALEKLPMDPAVEYKTRELLSLIEARGHEQDEMPVVFLSYPQNAGRYRDVVCERLGGTYRISRYDVLDGEEIVRNVIAKIEKSDYFIGIWHHEPHVSTSSRRYRSLSPWMLFEYGVALASEKPAIVVHSNKLDPIVSKRIAPGVAHPEYSDLKEFREKTIDTIWDYCQRHFR